MKNINVNNLLMAENKTLFFALDSYTKKSTTYNVYVLINNELKIVINEIKSNALGMSRLLDISDYIEHKTNINTTNWKLQRL